VTVVFDGGRLLASERGAVANDVAGVPAGSVQGMNDPVLRVFPLSMPWPTIDPFLFCVHHVDRYPAGNAKLGPAASLAGRNIGNDFAGTDGWRMYHGATVPGFPQHPHRGFETVTFVLRGLIDHSDSLGAAARYGGGDVQWLTAGRGIVHAEMFPLLRADADNPAELFQIWLNLPSDDKFAEPHFAMLWDEDIPRLEHVDDAGRRATVTVAAGIVEGRVPPAPPPSSWASRADSDVAIWLIELEAGATWTMPSTRHPEAARCLYLFEGTALDVGGHEMRGYEGAALRTDEPVELRAGDERVRCLVLQGRPIGEPVASYGPFVMNTRAEIEQAFADYQRTGFGGWPWPTDDPTHGPSPDRFARRTDGTVETPPAKPTEVLA